MHDLKISKGPLAEFSFVFFATWLACLLIGLRTMSAFTNLVFKTFSRQPLLVCLSIDSPASILHGPGSLCLIRGARGLIGQGRSVSRCRNTSMHKLRSYPVCALSSEVFLILIASIPPLLRAIAYLAISSQTLVSPFSIST